MGTGYFKVYRSIEEWEWSKNPFVYRVFMYCLAHARHTPGQYQGVQLQPGQLITGRDAISRDTGVSIQSVRTALKNLQKTGEITIEATNKFSTVTVVNWVKYQEQEGKDNQQTNQQLTNNQPTTNHKQECKEYKKYSPTPSKGDTRFDEFWNAYPKKIGKKNAQQRWQKLRINDETYHKIMEAVKAQSESDQWKKDGGQYIPYPATWLSQERWEDQLPTVEQHSEKPAMYSGDLYS